MNKINFSAPPSFGYENSRANADVAREKSGKKYLNQRKVISNLFKVLGYLPIVGTAVGVCRVVDSITSKKEYKSYQMESKPLKHFAGRLTRGVVETLSLGIVFLPIDLGVTIYRIAKNNYVDNKKLKNEQVHNSRDTSANVTEQLEHIQRECKEAGHDSYFIELLLDLHSKEKQELIKSKYSNGKPWAVYEFTSPGGDYVSSHIENFDKYSEYHSTMVANTQIYISNYKTAKENGCLEDFLKSYGRKGGCVEAKIEMSIEWMSQHVLEAQKKLDTLLEEAYRKFPDSDQGVRFLEWVEGHEFSYEKGIKVPIDRKAVIEFIILMGYDISEIPNK